MYVRRVGYRLKLRVYIMRTANITDGHLPKTVKRFAVDVPKIQKKINNTRKNRKCRITVR